MQHNPLTPRAIRALSAEADVAPATVLRRLAGRPTRPSTRERIEAAAKRLGVVLPETPGPATPGPVAS